MTLLQPPTFVNGAIHPARGFRMAIRDLARANEGIVQGDDLKIKQRATPGAGVRMVDGSGFIRGRFSAWQGTYHAYNVGDLDIPIAPTGASPRSDFIGLRVEDPEYEGTRNPATDDIVFPAVVSGVSGTQKTVPNSSWSAIPLARIDIPANTATITDAMITSLRVIANPRRDRQLLIAQHPATAHDLSSAAYVNWPNSAQWSLDIPSWATIAKIVGSVSGLRVNTAALSGNFHIVVGSSIATASTAYDYDAPTSTTYRTDVNNADTQSIPSNNRGTTQTANFQAKRTGGTGVLRADGGSFSILDIEFLETAV